MKRVIPFGQFVPGEWNHLAFVIDGDLLGHVRGIVNGEFWRGTTGLGALDAPTGPLTVGGATEEGPGFVGDFDDLRLFLRPLTTDLLRDHYQHPSDPGEHVLSVLTSFNLVLEGVGLLLLLWMVRQKYSQSAGTEASQQIAP